MYRCDIHTHSLGDTLDRYITVAQVIGLLGAFITRVSSGERANEEQGKPSVAFQRLGQRQLALIKVDYGGDFSHLVVW